MSNETKMIALETERFARIAKALEEDAKQPANFCAAYDKWEPIPAWLEWALRVVFVLAMAAAFLLAGLWVSA